jgi:GTPase SAR1 family protein
MTKIINLFAGPSAGKSSVAGALLSELKKRDIPADAPYEFPKVLAWDKNYPAIKDQLYVIGNQHRGISRSYGNVDYIIVDSPILLSLIYKNFYEQEPTYPGSFYDESFDNFILSLHKKYDNLNIFLERDEERFEDSGRYQNLEESKLIDQKLHTLLTENNIPYHSVHVDKSVDYILRLLNIK